jgi:integrase
MPRRESDDTPITDKLVRSLEPPETGYKKIYDGGPKRIAGFGVLITAADRRSFILTYRNEEGRQRRYTIGTYGPDQWSVAAARKKAGALKRAIANGDDPLEAKQQTRSAPTMRDLCDRYCEEHLPDKRESGAKNDRAMIRNTVKPKLGNRKVAAVTHSEIDKLRRDLKQTPFLANRTLSLLSTMFSLAMKWGWRSDNPAKGVTRYPEPKRTRYLTPDEFKRLTEALSKYPEMAKRPKFAAQVANVVRLLLLTGARSGEVLKAEWSQFNLEKGEWVKPGGTTKQKTEHRVPLSAPAVTLLKDILADAKTDNDGKLVSRFVFPGRNPDRPIPEFKDEWPVIRDMADLSDVRAHDLRHSFASVLASKGASLPMIGALLGHTNPATTARYTHLFSDPLRVLADEVGHVVTGTESDNVEPLRKDRPA